MSDRHPEIDYAYELTLEQLRYGAGLTDLERLVWLDQARQFTLMAREAQTVVYRAGEPLAISSRAEPDPADARRRGD